jgi:flavorubredoxin
LQKQLLVIYHTQTGRTGALAAAAATGAAREERVALVLRRAGDATLADLLGCSALMIGTPENFGTMSGMVKDFFDRTYYPAENQTIGLPYAVFISAGNDGRGAAREIDRIARGYGWRRVAEPLIVRGAATEEDLQACAELGESLASGIALGIY